MSDDARYFISYSKQLLNTAVLKNLPKDKFVIHMHVSENTSKNQLQLFQQLRSLGYSLSVSGLCRSNISPALMQLVDYCKFEPGKMDNLDMKDVISQYPKKLFIASGIDSAAAFETAKRSGFKLYQGFFFNQPVVTKKTKEIDPLKINYLRLIKLTSTDDYVDFQEISSVISSDVALSYKLLKLLNSAAVGLRNNISSIAMALAYLGEENLKKWISLLALRGINSDKPIELVRMSLVRAQFGELLAPHMHPKRDAKHVFLVGMLSLLHIALDKTQEELLEEIPVAEEIKNSLLTKTGAYSDIIAFFRNYEYSNWEEITRFAKENGLSGQTINDSYIAAVKWCNDLINAE